MGIRRLLGLSLRVHVGVGVLVAPAAGFAGMAPPLGVITYAPGAVSAVPTLSEWGLLAMALLLVLMAYRVLRNQLGGRPLASFVLAGALGLGMVSGEHALRSAYAIVVLPVVSLTSASGGSVNVVSYGLSQVTNDSGVPQTITSMVATGENRYFSTEFEATPPCAVGQVVAPAASCYVYVNSSVPE